jgi:hypothetical protein
MEDLKIYGMNFGAFFVSILDLINPILQTVVLLTSIIYTVMRIVKNLRDGKY